MSNKNQLIEETLAPSLYSFCEKLLKDEDEDLCQYLFKNEKAHFQIFCEDLIFSKDEDFVLYLIKRKKHENELQKIELQKRIDSITKETAFLEEIIDELNTQKKNETDEYIVFNKNTQEISEDKLIDILNHAYGLKTDKL